jgi:hypothetical protein
MAPPTGFDWFADFHCPGRLCLRVGGVKGSEVVQLSERVDGAGWLTVTNRHREWDGRGMAVLKSKTLAIRLANRWAAVHASRLRAEVFTMERLVLAKRTLGRVDGG